MEFRGGKPELMKKERTEFAFENEKNKDNLEIIVKNTSSTQLVAVNVKIHQALNWWC